MSSRCKPKAVCFGRDVRGLLVAAEAGQKADILTYSSGHLEPGSLNQGPPRGEPKQPSWRNPVSPTKALKKNAVKHCPSEFSARTASDVPRSRPPPAADCSSRADKTEETRLPKIDLCSPNSLVLTRPRPPRQKKSNPPSDMLGKQPSDQKGPSNKGQLKTKPRLGGKVVATRDLRAGINVAEIHERKLQNELKRLSAVSCCPGKDRLAVFADVFDDHVPSDAFQLSKSQERQSPWCDKRKWSSHWKLVVVQTEYDMYVNHLMASQPLLQNVPLETSLKGLGNDRVRKMDLEDSEKEVSGLEQEAERALQENKQARNELANIAATVGPEDSDLTNASLSELHDGGLDVGRSSSVRSKRLQVLNTWRENQQLEEELKERPVSSGTTAATQRCIKDLKMEILRLIASDNCLNTANKDFENNINTVLNREKARKTVGRTLWDEIHCDLQTREGIAPSAREPHDHSLDGISKGQ